MVMLPKWACLIHFILYLLFLVVQNCQILNAWNWIIHCHFSLSLLFILRSVLQKCFKLLQKYVALCVFYEVVILSCSRTKPCNLTRVAFISEVPGAMISCIDRAKMVGVWICTEIWEVLLVRIFECIRFSEPWSSSENARCFQYPLAPADCSPRPELWQQKLISFSPGKKGG